MKRFRNILRYIIVIALDVFMMVMFHSYINFLLLIGLIIFPFCSLAILKRVSENISLDIRTPLEPMYKKETFYVHITLSNPTYFPILNANINMMVENRFYLDFGEHTLNLPVRGRGETHVEYPVEMDYCGRFIVSVSHIILSDLLGIYEIKIPVSIQKECIVVPKGASKKEEAGIIYQNGVTEAMESKKKGYDFSEVTGIREYVPGDKLQNIHWKLSVKKEELMVKERTSVTAQQLNVLVDLINDESMCLESILELFDSVTRAFTEYNFPFTVYYYSSNFGELKDCFIGNEIQRKNCLEMILYDQSYKEPGLVEDLFVKQYQGGTYLYIGCSNSSYDSENVIEGEGNALAQLRDGNLGTFGYN